MRTDLDYFAVCDDETGIEIGNYEARADAQVAANIATTAADRDFFCDPRWGKIPKKLTSRKADDDAQERAFETARISLLTKSARTSQQFHFLLAFARDLSREFLLAGVPIPPAIAIAASAARSALGLRR